MVTSTLKIIVTAKMNGLKSSNQVGANPLHISSSSFYRNSILFLSTAALFGQGPLLEVDGDSKNRLVQSVAIQRYIASKVGLLGKDEWETFEIDMMAETLWDLRCCK